MEVWSFRNNSLEIMIDDRNWVNKIRKIHKFLDSLDTVKHLPPRFSRSMQSLVDYINDNFVNKI